MRVPAEALDKARLVYIHRRENSYEATSYESIWYGFPPFDEKNRKPVVSGKLFQYNRVFRRRRDLRMEGKLSETVKKWQELMA